MPIDEDAGSSEYATLVIDLECIEEDPELMQDVLVVCRVCKSKLISGKSKQKSPRRAMANKNYLGPVPPELKDLSVVEEAMISRCRAKCWIIQMRELDDREFPNMQRGFKGHIIVYPQRPSAVATTLPPSIEEITTPICVLFVGANPPSSEWIQTKAKPLIMRKERVLKALEWLSRHNHLCKDVFIDRSVFDGHGDVLHIPFHVEHIVPSVGIDSTTSSYAVNRAFDEPVDTLATESAPRRASDFDFEDMLRPFVSDTVSFESVVV
jgi:hypothetical protein